MVQREPLHAPQAAFYGAIKSNIYNPAIQRMFGLFVGHPADTVKVRMQAIKGLTMTKAIVTTWKNEGILGFYRGLLFPLLASGVYNCMFFGVYGNTLRAIVSEKTGKWRRVCCEEGDPGEDWHWKVGAAGAIGGLASAVVGCPIEVVKTQLQRNTGRNIHCTGPVSCLKYIYGLKGIRGLYKGFFLMTLREVPSFAIYILAYEHVACMWRGEKVAPGAPLGVMPEIMAGGVAGSLSWMLVVPVDVLKTRVQADSTRNPVYKSTLDCFRKTWKEGGAPLLFRGFWISAVRGFPVNSATFVAYEMFHSLFRRLFREDD